MRVAVAQFATSSNSQENLATCIRMINKVAECEPSLIVLPAFCNTLFSTVHSSNGQPSYIDHNQAWNEALEINGSFIQQIAQQATTHRCYIVLNVTLRQDLTRDHQNGLVKSNISVTSCLFSPLGELIHQSDKQTLTDHESDFFISASKVAEVLTTPFGKLGFLAGSDASSFEASRLLAIGGAQLLCDSQSSFAYDQSHLHDLTLACENNLFVATANKIGSLISANQSQEHSQEHLQEHSEEHSEEEGTVLSRHSSIPHKYLIGVGHSQIVSPNGKVLAKLDNNDEGFIFADIDLAGVGFNNKYRPDGTEISKQRRPELYQEQLLLTEQAPKRELALDNNTVPETANVAIFATYTSNEQAIEDVCHYIENNLSDIIQLPELFFIADKTITNNAEQLAKIGYLSTELIKQISAVLRPFQYVCTSLVINGAHQAVLISEHGLYATQQQLHFCQRYQWTALGNDLNIIELPLEQGNIKVAMLTADDANIPEIVKVAALNNIHVLLVPFDIQEPCEVEYSLLSRAAENRICIVAASREKSFANKSQTENNNDNGANKNKVKQKKSTGLIANLTTESALLSQWKLAKYTGYLNKPLIKHQYGKITKAVIHPIAAVNKIILT